MGKRKKISATNSPLNYHPFFLPFFLEIRNYLQILMVAVFFNLDRSRLESGSSSQENKKDTSNLSGNPIDYTKLKSLYFLLLNDTKSLLERKKKQVES